MNTTQTPDKVASVPATAITQSITPNAHERSEWMRISVSAAKQGCYNLALTFDEASRATEMPFARFDALQTEYRQWLIRGFAVQIAAQASF